MKFILFVLTFTFSYSYFCMKDSNGIKREPISYELYKVNNITNVIDVSLCGPIDDFENASIRYKGRQNVALNALSTEQIVSRENNSMEIHYHLYNSIPDCDDYKLHVKYTCKLQNISLPIITGVDYDTADVFFCTNIMFVSFSFLFINSNVFY